MHEFPDIEARRLNWDRALTRLAKASGWDRTYVSMLRKQIKRHAKNLKQIARQSRAGNEHQMIRLQTTILESFRARLCGTLEEISRFRGCAEPLSPMTQSAFEQMLQTNPLVGERPDMCQVFSIRKSNGKMREVVKPGPKTRAAQNALAITLKSQELESPYEFNCKGRGDKAALQEIQRLMSEEGFRWFIVFDFNKFFTSVKPKHLKSFKLTNDVLHNVVFSTSCATLFRRDNNVTKLSFGAKCEPARRGIPQGATTSGILTSAFLGRELRQLGGDLGIVTYSDDVVIGARTQSEAKEVAQALKTRFANHNGGPIHFKHIGIRDVREGLEFLGHWIRLVEVDGEWEVRFRPSHQAKNRFRQNLQRRLREKGPDLTWDEAMEILSSYRANWIAQKPLWQPSEFEMVEFEIESECWVDDYFHGWTKKMPIAGNKICAKC